MEAKMLRFWFIPILFASLCLVAHAAIPTEATILDADTVWDPCLVDGVVVSPNGKQIVYVSRGALWLCGVHAGPPKKIADLPNTVSDFLSRPEYQSDREKYANFTSHAGLHPLGPQGPELTILLSLRWTRSQDGATYALWNRLKQNSMLSSYRVMHASTEGVVTQLADIHRDMVPLPENKMAFHVDPKRRYVVLSNYGIPLIWEIATNKPRVTPFDVLLPSTTSDRYLGVEIDTRQLVLADKDFQIIKRFDVVLDHDRRCDLFWSPDERTAVCRSFRSSQEPISDKCTFFKYDLESDKQDETREGWESDRFYFPHPGSEVVRVGRDATVHGGYADGSNGTFIERMPNEQPIVELLHFVRLPKRTDNYKEHRTYPPVIASNNALMYALALPRPDNKPRGYHFNLVDLNGDTWPFQPTVTSQYYTPYLPLSFADNDKTLIARDGSQLFSISVDSIKTAEIPADD
jgi:hypothetical protein